MSKPSRRPQCSVFIATSLDGYIARSDGSLDWLDVVQSPNEDYGYRRFMESIDTLVVGRRTYDKVLTFGDWPYVAKRCVVLTHAEYEARHGEEFFSGPPTELVARLGVEGARRIYVDGGNVIRGFLEADLLDDLTLSIVPTILGSGIPLFGPGVSERSFVQEECRSFPSGLVQVRYRTTRDHTSD